MSTLFVLMGSGNTRKSVTIRALTGFTRNGNGRIRPWDVRLEDGVIIKVCVFSVSPQEDNISVLEFANKIADIDPNWNILLALHPDDRAVEYIQAVTREYGYEIRIAPLGMAEIPPNLQREFHNRGLYPQVISPGIANSGRMPPNEIASHIRREWGWL